MRSERLSWSETRARLRADRARLVEMLSRERGRPPSTVVLHPSYVCVWLYRLAHHFHRGGHRHVGRLFWHLNALLTGADISPPADLDGGLVIAHPPGTAISANAGRNLTMMPLSGIGSELGRRADIGAGPGLPVLGDDVVLEPLAGILGPVRVGNRVRVAAGAVLTRDAPDDTVVAGPPPRFLGRTATR